MRANKIIDILLTDFQTDKAGLASILNVHKSTISNISKGYTKKISSKLAQNIITKKPKLNYDFLIGKSKNIYVHKNNEELGNDNGMPINLTTKISINEISYFILNNLEAFEKNPIFKLYINSIRNKVKVELLEEQIYFKKIMDEIDKI